MVRGNFVQTLSRTGGPALVWTLCSYFRSMCIDSFALVPWAVDRGCLVRAGTEGK
jgi:hypothetical protein